MNLKKLTLQQIRNCEAFHYVVTNHNCLGSPTDCYTFTDEQFHDFIWEQIRLGVDDIEIQIRDTEFYYFTDSPVSRIYFFDMLIQEGKCAIKYNFKGVA